MQHKFSIRYLPGGGDILLFGRFVNILDQFWDFDELEWVTIETPGCRVALVEVPEEETTDTRYSVIVDRPDEAVSEEIIDVVTGDVFPGDISTGTSINQIQSNIENVLSCVGTLLDIGQGKWAIQNKQMVLYKRDGSELMRFDLKDRNELPSDAEVFSRVPV